MFKLINIGKNYGNTKIIDGLTLDIPDNQNIVFFGPNGCGKTTLLKIIAGLEKYENGEIKYLTNNNEPAKTGLIMQDYRSSLLPWKTIRDNIKFVANLNHKDKAEKHKETDAIITKLNLRQYQDKFPYETSGGISQLTAIGRAMAMESDIFLLDEPFSSLDYHTSSKLQLQFISLLEEIKKQAIIVTHSIEEAILLSDQIVIFSSLPMKVIEIINNELPHPRQIEQLGSDIAQKLRQRIINNAKTFLL